PALHSFPTRRSSDLTGASFLSGAIYYRQGGEQSYETDTLVVNALLGRPVASIPERVVGARGVEYWVEVRTLTRTLTFPGPDSARSEEHTSELQSRVD